MKKFFIIAALFAAVCSTAQAEYVKKGNNYVTSSSSTSKRDTIITSFTWNGDPIIVSKANGYSWVGKVSDKSGKYYRKPVPEDIAKDVCKQIGIPYTYVKKSKSAKK